MRTRVLVAFFHFFLGLVPRSKTIFCFTQPKRFLSKRMNERVPSSQSSTFHQIRIRFRAKSRKMGCRVPPQSARRPCPTPSLPDLPSGSRPARLKCQRYPCPVHLRVCTLTHGGGGPALAPSLTPSRCLLAATISVAPCRCAPLSLSLR